MRLTRGAVPSTAQMRRELNRNRIVPRTPPGAMVTYRVSSPILTHTRPATCDEVDCPQWINGWDTIVAKGSDLEALIRETARGHGPDGVRRPFARVSDTGPTLTFHYAPGTPCFRMSLHRTSLHRPEFYTKRAGDWRQDRGLIRRHTKPEHWVEDSQENFDKVRRQING